MIITAAVMMAASFSRTKILMAITIMAAIKPGKSAHISKRIY